MIQSLNEILQYTNEDVVQRFSRDHQVGIEDAREIFIEMKRWLWLAAKQTAAVEAGAPYIPIPLFNEARAVDLMWHTFLLYSRDYMEFCERYFGFYLHHQPRPYSEQLNWREKISTDPAAAEAERKQLLAQVYELIYDELGEETLLKWCEEYPERFQFKYLTLDR